MASICHNGLNLIPLPLKSDEISQNWFGRCVSTKPLPEPMMTLSNNAHVGRVHAAILKSCICMTDDDLKWRFANSSADCCPVPNDIMAKARERRRGAGTGLSKLPSIYNWLFLIYEPLPQNSQFSTANLALAGFPQTNALGESMPSRH